MKKLLMEHNHYHESEEPKQIEWTVEGMSCTSCASTVTRFLEKRGMKNVFVDFSTGEVKFDAAGNFSKEEIVNGINALGYHVAKAEEDERGSGRGFLHSLESRFYFSLAFTIPLMLHMVLPVAFLHNGIVQLILCIPVFLVGFFHFGKSSWGSLKEGVPNMDVLIFIGSTAAFVYSLVGGIFLRNPDYLFFETSAAIITLVLLGNVIEMKSVKRTRSAVEELTKLQPQKARLIDFYGDEKFEVVTEIDQHDIRVGQHFLVNSGDRIPADGKIVWGSASINESMITGESLPVAKQRGDDVIAGTIVMDGSIKMGATAIGDQTVLSHIIELVSTAQRNRPNIQKLADKVTAVFVPVVLSVAALTFVLSLFAFHIPLQDAVMNSIAVLVIACPCAMGLATPTAVMVGIGKAARQGILIKGAQTLETFASVKTIVFDKTGTLTSGDFRIQEMNATGITEQELKSILFSVESYSSHPIAKSIVRELNSVDSIKLKNIVEQKGVAVRASDEEGTTYEVGSARILSSEDSQELSASWNVFVKKNEKLVGRIEVRDAVREGAKEMIDSLKRSRIKTIMLSGDKNENCRRIAGELGIDEFFSEKLPDEKLKIIEQLRLKGTVAMVGDGVNDAPSLAAATIGVSLSHATQVAIDSAQIILLHNDLSLLPKAIATSKQTLSTIKQNLFWAFFYNTLAIPVAAVGYLKPILAALSMAFSDVIVIGNSLRLRIRK